MRIAFVTYECPPDTAYGGIATYTGQAVSMLANAGHSVEVFTASSNRDGTFVENGAIVHRVREQGRLGFAEQIAPIFAARHRAEPFDVLEAPEYFADARIIVSLVPEIPLVLRLHTPSFLLWQMELAGHLAARLRHRLGAMRRGILYGGHPKSGFEYAHAMQADVWASPSESLAEITRTGWDLPKERVRVLPYPFVSSPELLAIPIETNTRCVLYVGRLEVRKGVLDLADAVVGVRKRLPDVRFRFVGRSVPNPQGVEMSEILQKRLERHRSSVEFIGGVPSLELPRYFAEADICVFPSHWENFPNVCLEAMAAGRGIIGSSEGGMAEMLRDEAGVTIAPEQPFPLANSICTLLADPALRQELARNARNRVLSEYAPERIAPLTLSVYEQAITHRRLVGARWNVAS